MRPFDDILRRDAEERDQLVRTFCPPLFDPNTLG